MRNLFKNYRSQDSGLRPLDEMFIISFLTITFIFLAILILQGKEMKQLRNDLTTIQLDKRVVAIDKETYKNLIHDNVIKRLSENGMR